jgi:hypothetical protein
MDNQSGNDNLVKMIEANKQIFGIAIKHASMYECKKAYDFMYDLVKVSEKYAKYRTALEAALI